MNGLSITLFGPPQITRGKQQITLQRRKDLALLVYLVVTAQPHTRDTIAALLWPDSEQSLARANVRKNISRLRSDLGEDFLLTSSDQVSINPNISLWVDVRQFQSHLEQPKKHNHILQDKGQPLCETCQSALENAVQLYRSGFLEGFILPDSRTFDEWQFFQSEGYRQNLSEALQRLIQQYIQLEQYGRAIEHCRRWLAMDTLNESAHRQMMLAYALGGQQAAALRQFEECSRLLREELGVEPEPETISLHEAIRTKRINRPRDSIEFISPGQKSSYEPTEISAASKFMHNLPVTTTPFVGRGRELAEIKRSFEEASCRVVTLLGPGGSGKTRLAIQAGTSLYDEGNFSDGVWFIQLAPLTDPASIVPTIQKELTIPTPPSQENSSQNLVNYLRNRKSLLILDNFEHLLTTESITLISELVNNAPQVKTLITSRERLNIRSEQLFPVEGLESPTDEALASKPDADSQQDAYSAIQLFEQSAQRVQPEFSITRDNFKLVAHICQHIQGMPLAIELAAAWTEALSLEDIHKEIEQDLDFLRSELHDTPDRQRSLRAVFDSSWVKLSTTTRSTIKALSVFRSPFTRKAAQAITGISAKTLLELTNKSWIQAQKDGRYQIHELLRQFVYEMLENEPVTFEQIKDKYCTYYANLLSMLWETVKGPGYSKFFTELEFEYENVRTAWTWLTQKGEFETIVDHLLPSIFTYSEIRGKSFELVRLCETALSALVKGADANDQNRAEIILRIAQGAFWEDGHPVRYEFFDGVYPIYQDAIHKAWTLFQDSFNLYELGFWGILLAYIYDHTIQQGAAINLLKEAIPQFQNNNRIWELANAKLHLARLLLPLDFEDGQTTKEEVHQNLTEALELFNQIGDKSNYGQTLRQLGNLKMKEQELLEAIRLWREARANLLSVDINEWAAASSINWQIGDAYLQLGQFETAFVCFQEISRVNLDHGFIQQAVGALSKESFEKARYGSLEDAINIRKRCIDFIQETGPDYQLAWSLWEMGELMRLAGNIDEARQRLESALEIFKKYQDNVGLSFYWRAVGDLAVQEKDFDSARQYFEKCEQFAHAARHNWMVAYSLKSLGVVDLEENNTKAAKTSFVEALRLARKVHDPGITHAILANISKLYVHENNHQRAVELGAFILNHFASWNETKAHANTLLAEIKHDMLPREFNELKKKSQGLDLWNSVDEIIAELD